MTAADLDVLLSMGFEQARAELAAKKTGNLQQALDWLEANQEKSLEELQAQNQVAAEDDNEEGAGPSIPTGETAQSIVCDDCGKKFRTHDQASFHAAKTDHQSFSESTDEIAPLTEEEKKARLEELRAKLAAKKAVQSEQDKETAKRNEQIRMKATKDSQELKEELQRKERLKDVEKKKQEKIADAEAKKRIKAKIEADKAERKRKEEEAKALREGRAPQAPAAAPATPLASLGGASSSGSSAATARLRIQTKQKGNLMKTYPSETTLFEVAHAVEEETGVPVQSFQINFPRKTFEAGVDFGMTLKEAGFVPSAAIIAN
ncbi:hypothetical protein QBC40DRAFT_278262 [Triangularia verruculosa]|uniref:C2H2-type domain-containing protein n=1 Tax=Triangularia verruculosa TaxID=2587418 RepID=A0AAN6XIU6_9PEZI|nr:hypothetical protein QBC40DRAFT_278262 [Triangularia verruculosa]